MHFFALPGDAGSLTPNGICSIFYYISLPYITSIQAETSADLHEFPTIDARILQCRDQTICISSAGAITAAVEKGGIGLMQEHSGVVTTHSRTGIVAVAASLHRIEVRAQKHNRAGLGVTFDEEEAIDDALPPQPRQHQPGRMNEPADADGGALTATGAATTRAGEFPQRWSTTTMTTEIGEIPGREGLLDDPADRTVTHGLLLLRQRKKHHSFFFQASPASSQTSL